MSASSADEEAIIVIDLVTYGKDTLYRAVSATADPVVYGQPDT